MPPATEHRWYGTRTRSCVLLAFGASLLAVFLILALDGTRPGQLLGAAIAALALVPFFTWWVYTHVLRRPLVVSVSPAGITPHEWARTPIPWSEVRAMWLGTHTVHRVLVVQTTRSRTVLDALRPFHRCTIRMLGWRAVLPDAGGLTVTLTLLRPEDREQFLAVLEELGHL